MEDSGLLVANGVEPVVDDLFLWSRLYDRGGSFAEGRALLDAVSVHRFQTIVSETDLAHLQGSRSWRVTRPLRRAAAALRQARRSR